MSYSNIRKVTNYLYDMMDNGAIEPRALAEMCLQYMSEDEVADMAQSNDLILEDEEGDEDEDSATI